MNPILAVVPRSHGASQTSSGHHTGRVGPASAIYRRGSLSGESRQSRSRCVGSRPRGCAPGRRSARRNVDAAGLRARFVQTNELIPTSNAERPSQVFLALSSMPFVRFFIFENRRFQAVHSRLPNAHPARSRPSIASSGDIPGWQSHLEFPREPCGIPKSFLEKVAGVTGCAGVRVARVLCP